MTFQIGGDKDDKPKQAEEDEPVSTTQIVICSDKINTNNILNRPPLSLFCLSIMVCNNYI